MRLREEIPMLLEEHPKPIKLPFTDLEKMLAFFGVLFAAIGVTMMIMSETATSGIVFASLGGAIILFVLACQIPAFMSVQRNKEHLIKPIQQELEKHGYHLSSFKILRMWEEGSIKKHGREYYAGGRQSKKFILSII